MHTEQLSCSGSLNYNSSEIVVSNLCNLYHRYLCPSVLISGLENNFILWTFNFFIRVRKKTVLIRVDSWFRLSVCILCIFVILLFFVVSLKIKNPELRWIQGFELTECISLLSYVESEGVVEPADPQLAARAEVLAYFEVQSIGQTVRNHKD